MPLQRWKLAIDTTGAPSFYRIYFAQQALHRLYQRHRLLKGSSVTDLLYLLLLYRPLKRVSDFGYCSVWCLWRTVRIFDLACYLRVLLEFVKTSHWAYCYQGAWSFSRDSFSKSCSDRCCSLAAWMILAGVWSLMLSFDLGVWRLIIC